MNNPMEKYLGKGPESGAEDSTAISEQISFSMPTGFKVPDGVGDGESFDAMATLKVVGGKLVLDELDGLPVSDSTELEDPPESESEDLSEDLLENEDSSDVEPTASEEDPESSGEEDEEDSEGLDFLEAIEKKAGKKKPAKKY